MRKTWSVNCKKNRTFSQKASAAALWSLLVLNPSYEWITYLQTLMSRFKLLVYLIPLAKSEDRASNDNSDEFFNDAKSVDWLFGEIKSLNCCEQDNLRFRLLQRKFLQQVYSHSMIVVRVKFNLAWWDYQSDYTNVAVQVPKKLPQRRRTWAATFGPSVANCTSLKTLGSNSYNSLESSLEDSSIVIMIPYYIPNIILGGLANSCCWLAYWGGRRVNTK